MYTNIKSLSPKTNIMLYINFTSIKKVLFLFHISLHVTSSLTWSPIPQSRLEYLLFYALMPLSTHTTLHLYIQ